MSDDGAKFILRCTGSLPVVPGHPLVIACTILLAYETYLSAAKVKAFNASAAQADSRIPGCGDQVVTALEMLRLGFEGGTVDQMIEYARDSWIDSVAGGHKNNVLAGTAQAALMEPYFRETAGKWVAQGRAVETST